MRLKLTLFLITLSTVAFGQANRLYKFRAENGKYGFIDSKGIIKVKPSYLFVQKFGDGLCFVSKEVIAKGYKWICIDTVGNEIFDIQDNSPETEFNEGYARISSFTEHWFINKKGENIFNKTWKDGHGNFKNGIAYVSDTQFMNFYPIDTNGARVGNTTYSRIYVNEKLNAHATANFTTDTLVAFRQNGLWGFKNSKNEIVVKPKYYLVDKFKNGLCAVRMHYQDYEIINDYFLDAIIDIKGKVISEQPMHCYLGFQGDLIVYYGGLHFTGGVHYLDKNGQKIIPKE
jgi:hypothetical protein